MNTQLGQVYAEHGQDLGDLEAAIEIPVLAGMQAQGDVLIVPTRPGVDTGTPIPPEGVAVVRGENGGNTHLLVGENISWRPLRADPRELALGVVTVPAGSAAWLLHPEHGANGIAPGTYELRRQREQGDELRLVAD